jgi:hypothetical protein
MRRRSMVTGTARAPLSVRGADLYETPDVAVRALMRVEQLVFNDKNVIWEPACGPGAIVRVLRAAGHTVIATDLIDYGCPNSRGGIDFLTETMAPTGCELIVTNPPFKIANAFATRALELVPRVMLLVRLAFLESEVRSEILEDGRLARVHVFANRLPRMHRAGWEGKKSTRRHGVRVVRLGARPPWRGENRSVEDDKVCGLR